MDQRRLALSLALFVCICGVDLQETQAKLRDGDSDFYRRPPCGKFTTPPEAFKRNRTATNYDAQPGEAPFVVRIEIWQGVLGWYHNCGGVVIDEWRVLTAASCVAGAQPESLRIWVGDRDKGAVDPLEETFYATKVIVHENYNANLLVNDLALIYLADPIKFKVTREGARNRICLPSQPDTPYKDGDDVIIAGWGLTNIDGPPTAVLQVAHYSSLVTRDACNDLLFGALDSSVDVVCAVHEHRDTCQEDLGGPLYRLVDNGRIQELVGITSWLLQPCGEPRPTVYTRVDRYLDWIEGWHAGGDAYPIKKKPKQSSE